MSWNPSLYLSFADERTRPAADLLGRVATDNPEHVMDLGCGPGNSTGLLAARWPDAKIEGIDSSPAMIDAAKASGVPAHFSVDD
ncbi:MAG TPA: methyltransferase domain-containing protein, partial [Rhizomicrobium sp.]|nr:methyltransferase domain-containing protein [Rhizomicrobium sp.]